jgi:FkbH-like protein
VKIALLGNVTLDFLAQDFRRAGHDVYVPSGFDTWRQEVLDSASGLHAFAPDAVLLVMEGGVSPGDTKILDALAPVHDAKDADAQQRVPPPRVVVPDIAALAAETPGFWDARMRTLAAMPFSLAGLKAIEDEFFFAVDSAPKKILAVDADNTLWDGIVSEDGATEVAPHVEFQKGLLALKARGVLLVLLSKNDPHTPREGRAAARPRNGETGACHDQTPLVQALARADMPITLDDFSAVRANWSPKAGNLLTVCRELNLGTDSVVFVDDNPHERAQMKAHLPEVVVPPFPADLTRPAQFLRRLEQYFFTSAGTTAEDRARAEMYRAEAARRNFARTLPTVQDYLKGLHLTVRAARATAEDVPRLAQMAGKTNQFNATTIRRTAEEMAALVSDPAHRVWTFRAGDAFGEMGLVCYIIYNCATARISDFVMSCRAMGRTLEHFAVNRVRRELAAEGLPLAGIDCVPTAKNGPFREFLSTLDLSRDAVTWYGEC